MKHTLCDLQEKIFHLQIQLLEEDIAGGERGRFWWRHRTPPKRVFSVCWSSLQRLRRQADIAAPAIHINGAPFPRQPP